MNNHIRTTDRALRMFAIALAALTLLVFAATASAAAGPDSIPVRGSAEVDGIIGDWDTGISEPPTDISAAWPSNSQWTASTSAPFW